MSDPAAPTPNIEFEICTESHPAKQLYRAELWVRPYEGWMVAATRYVSTRSWATRDGARVFGPFMAERMKRRRKHR